MAVLAPRQKMSFCEAAWFVTVPGDKHAPIPSVARIVLQRLDFQKLT
jgi:hypothetical protein